MPKDAESCDLFDESKETPLFKNVVKCESKETPIFNAWNFRKIDLQSGDTLNYVLPSTS